MDTYINLRAGHTTKTNNTYLRLIADIIGQWVTVTIEHDSDNYLLALVGKSSQVNRAKEALEKANIGLTYVSNISNQEVAYFEIA